MRAMRSPGPSAIAPGRLKAAMKNRLAGLVEAQGFYYDLAEVAGICTPVEKIVGEILFCIRKNLFCIANILIFQLSRFVNIYYLIQYIFYHLNNCQYETILPF